MTTETRSPESVQPSDTTPPSAPWSSYLHLQNLRRTLICAALGLGASWVTGLALSVGNHSDGSQELPWLIAPGSAFSLLVVGPIALWSGRNWWRIALTVVWTSGAFPAGLLLLTVIPETIQSVLSWLFPDERKFIDLRPAIFLGGSLGTVLAILPLVSWQTMPRVIALVLWPCVGAIASYLMAVLNTDRLMNSLPMNHPQLTELLGIVAFFSVWQVPMAAILSLRLWQPRSEKAVANES